MNPDPHTTLPSTAPVRRRRATAFIASLGAAALGVLLHASVLAQGLTVLDSRNGSSDAFLDLHPAHAYRFASALEVSALAADAHTQGVELRLSWMMAALHEPNGLPVIDLHPTIGWTLTLRVEDPHEQGYRLDVDTRLRGLLGGSVHPVGTAELSVPALRYGYYEVFDTVPAPLPGAGSPAQDLSVVGNDLEGRRLVDAGGSADLGRYRGTRSFLFFLEATDLRLFTFGTNADVLAWQQFGQVTDVSRLAFANPDFSGLEGDSLGQFFRVSATFDAAPVPEPASWALLAGGGLLLMARRVRRGAAGALALGALLVAGPAQAADLVARSSNVFGNFTVGAFAIVDSGGFSEFLTTPTLAYGQEASDAGAVNGIWNDTPVQGSASFASGTHFVFDPMHVVGNGHAETTGATPFDYVSLAANAISSLRLEFTVPQLTAFTLTGSVLAAPGVDVGPRVSQASASVQFTGCVGCAWNASTAPGAFMGSGMLIPGNFYTLRGDASARLNGGGQWSFDLVLTPVPEPAAWALLALGLPALCWRRFSAPAARGSRAMRRRPAHRTPGN